jgi:hypothetical protein
LPLVVLVAMLAAGGCGGGDEPASDSDEEQAVIDAVTTFNQALEAQDGTAGCAVLTEEAQQYVQDFTGEKSCEQAIDGFNVGPSDYASREVRVVEIDGESAVAQSVTKDGPIRVPLENVDGEWKITDPPI